MAKVAKTLKLQKKGRGSRYNEIGSIEIRNETGEAADLYFFGDINSESWGEWQKYYPEDRAPKDVQDFLDQLDGVQKINVHINSGGGSVFGGIAIYNILKRHSAEITVYVEGLAASIASVIAMAGDRIIIPENAQMMVHKPSSLAWGNADEMRKEADVLDGCQKVILNTYMQHVKEGITPEQINVLIDAETWKNGREWQEFFDIEVSEKSNAAACTSEYFCHYRNLPEELEGKQPGLQADDIGGIADALAERLKEMLGDRQAQDAGRDRQAQAILEDLDYI